MRVHVQCVYVCVCVCAVCMCVCMCVKTSGVALFGPDEGVFDLGGQVLGVLGAHCVSWVQRPTAVLVNGGR
jgi:hypothetical protein